MSNNISSFDEQSIFIFVITISYNFTIDVVQLHIQTCPRLLLYRTNALASVTKEFINFS